MFPWCSNANCCKHLLRLSNTGNNFMQLVRAINVALQVAVWCCAHYTLLVLPLPRARNVLVTESRRRFSCVEHKAASCSKMLPALFGLKKGGRGASFFSVTRTGIELNAKSFMSTCTQSKWILKDVISTKINWLVENRLKISANLVDRGDWSKRNICS